MDNEPSTPKDKIRESGFGARQAKRQQQELKRMRFEDPRTLETLRQQQEVSAMYRNDPQQLARRAVVNSKIAMMHNDNSYWALEAFLDLWNNEELF